MTWHEADRIFVTTSTYTCVYTGMKAIPRFREAIAFLKLRHQPAHIKYPLVALQVASNPGIYSAEQLNVKEEVKCYFLHSSS